MTFGPLYHWSPRSNRVRILQHGLQAGREDRDAKADGMHGVHWPYVCFSPDPLRAWSLLPVEPEEMEEHWDLWLVHLVDTDQVDVRTDYAPEIAEVRVYNTIPGDRVHWIGEREAHAGLSIQPVSEWNTDLLE